MAQISRITTWTSGQTLTAAALNTEFNNFITAWNNADSGTTAWGTVNANAFTMTSTSSTAFAINTNDFLLNASTHTVGIRMSPLATLDVEKGVNVTSGAFETVSRFKAAAADVTDQPGIMLGYNNAGTTCIIAAATQANGQPLEFWTFDGSAWAARAQISKTGFFGVTMTPSVSIDAEKGTNVTAGAFETVLRAKAAAADVADQPGIMLGYNNAGTSCIVAASSQGNGQPLEFWTFQGSSWGARMQISKLGSIIPGTAALATNATDGFIYSQSCAGAPSGTPTTFTGRLAMIYDSTNNQLCIYNGAWKKVTLS